MFDIGLGELLLVFVVGLMVLGPQRLLVAVRTVAGWIRALRSLATTVQNELTQELKLREFQDSLKKVEKASLDNLTSELKESMDELHHASEKTNDKAHTIRNPVVKAYEAQHEGVTLGAAEHQVSALQQAPENVPKENVPAKPPVAKTAALVSDSTPSASDKS